MTLARKNPESRESLECFRLWDSLAVLSLCIFLLDYSWRQGAALFQQFYILALIQTTWNREGPFVYSRPVQSSRLSSFSFFRKKWKQKRSNMSISQRGHCWCPRRKTEPFTRRRPSAIAPKMWKINKLIAAGRATCFPVWDSFSPVWPLWLASLLSR